jgi:GNAT superfamily N-acetyltransferase
MKTAAMSRSDHPGSASDAAIRQASAADLPAVRELTRQAYARYLERMDVLPAPVRNDYEAEAAAGQIWVVNLGEPTGKTGAPALAGLIVLIEAGDSLLIENVAVNPAAQGMGLGRRLMEFAEVQARARGLGRMTLYTHEVMTENLAIYSHLGYRETRRAQQGVYRRVFMEKRLD